MPVSYTHLDVYKRQGVYSSIAAAYNVQSLPAVFLINKKSELSARGETIKDLDAAVKALLLSLIHI